jgi:thiol:disulfide interchange protein
MNKALKPFWFLLAAIVLVLGFSMLNRESTAAERVPWRSNFTAAQDEATKTSKPLFLYFTAEWCGPCQSMKHTTWADADVEKALSSYVPVKIDIDAHPDLANKYPSEGIPHFVIAKSDGTMLREQVGALPPREFLDWLNAKM